jgi:hypothetical protein
MELVHSHHFPKLYDLQKEKTWNQRAGMDVSDRVGKRVGILGYGSIGRQGMFTSRFSLITFVKGRRLVLALCRLITHPNCAYKHPQPEPTPNIPQNMPLARYTRSKTIAKRHDQNLSSGTNAMSLMHAPILPTTPSNPSPTPPWQPYRLRDPKIRKTAFRCE